MYNTNKYLNIIHEKINTFGKKKKVLLLKNKIQYTTQFTSFSHINLTHIECSICKKVKNKNISNYKYNI